MALQLRAQRLPTSEEDNLNSEFQTDWHPSTPSRSVHLHLGGRWCLRGLWVIAMVTLVSLAVAVQIEADATLPNSREQLPSVETPPGRLVKTLVAPDVQWTCTNQNGSVSVPAHVPSVVHMALLAAGVLTSDPLYRYNELEHAWVGLDAWTYSARFSLDASDTTDAGILGSARPVLQLDGVDTVAKVWLNGQLLGSTSSAFVVWRLPLPRELLVAGDNRLDVAFEPPRASAHRLAAAHPYPVPHTQVTSYPAPPRTSHPNTSPLSLPHLHRHTRASDSPPPPPPPPHPLQYYHVWSEPSHRNFIRKPPSDFGWDWGPSFLPTGITGSVSLHDDGALLENVRTSQLFLQVRPAPQLQPSAPSRSSSPLPSAQTPQLQPSALGSHPSACSLCGIGSRLRHPSACSLCGIGSRLRHPSACSLCGIGSRLRHPSACSLIHRAAV